MLRAVLLRVLVAAGEQEAAPVQFQRGPHGQILLLQVMKGRVQRGPERSPAATSAAPPCPCTHREPLQGAAGLVDAPPLQELAARDARVGLRQGWGGADAMQGI